MKILLIKPPTSEKIFSWGDFWMNEPLELEYVAAGVCDKYDVRILDMRLDKSLEKHLEEYGPDIVGLTSYTSQVYITKNLCKKIKAFNPGILTAVGGLHATVAPEDFCDPDLDIIVRGEGVFTFREIVERLENKQEVTDVKGIACYHPAGLKYTEPRDHPDLDSYPFPNRSLTEHYREYYFTEPPEGIWKPLASLRASRGCPYRCKFCSVWKFTKGRYLPRDPHAILAELTGIEEPFVDLIDDEAFIDVERMEKLADLIINSGIKKKFSSAARSDTVVNHPDLFRKWKEAGLLRVQLGLESNRPKDLEYFRKENTTDNNERAVSILREVGVMVDASFIVTPDYDIEDFDILADYAKNLGADFVLVTPLTPFPGTDLYNELKDQLTTTNLEFFNFLNVVLPTKLPLKKFYREMAYLFYRTNKVSGGAYNQSHARKFMRFYKEQKNRHLQHQAK